MVKISCVKHGTFLLFRDSLYYTGSRRIVFFSYAIFFLSFLKKKIPPAVLAIYKAKKRKVVAEKRKVVALRPGAPSIKKIK